MHKPNLFVVGLPHTDGNKDYMSCAYSQKHVKFCRMLMSLDYNVYSLFGEHSDFDATEHIIVTSDEDKQRWFGDFDYHTKFYPITWETYDKHWVEMNDNAIKEIANRYTPGDFICLIGGVCQKQIADAFPYATIIEYGIGYTGIFSPFKVFESYAHMHWMYGNQNTDNGGAYDVVIPNYFDVNDFWSSEKEDYYLYIGRLTERKGVEIAVEATRRVGKKLILAGQGAIDRTPGRIISEEGVTYEGDHIEHVGSVNSEERADLMGKALATFVPTSYIEPFGGVSIESMLCGTPVITTDWGAFAENNITGLSGYRFRTIGEATEAAIMAPELDSKAIIEYAERNFSTETIKYKYNDYFMQISDLITGGGYYSDWHGDLSIRYGPF